MRSHIIFGHVGQHPNCEVCLAAKMQRKRKNRKDLKLTAKEILKMAEDRGLVDANGQVQRWNLLVLMDGLGGPLVESKWY